MLRITKGQLPCGTSEITTFARASQARTSVMEKFALMRAIDQKKADLMPDIDKVVVVEHNLHSDLDWRQRPLSPTRLTGTASFEGDAPKTLELTENKSDYLVGPTTSSYRFQLLPDGSKLYAAPTQGGGYQVLKETASGTLFIPDKSDDLEAALEAMRSHRV